jgi:phosphoserine aminotransferase
MTLPTKPTQKPQRPYFSSGPCAKRPGWHAGVLENALLGRSHRSGSGKAALKFVIEEQRRLLGIPDDYLVGIMPASDTGAIEMAMWSMLGARGVDAIAWESFGADWQKDIKDQLKLEDVRYISAEYGEIPDLLQVDPSRDIVFTWNGTTSGVRVPNADWISAQREGLTFCDATSAVFAYDLDWSKLDVTTWSWQKVLGGEAAHGMLVLSPRAVERLESFKPDRPLPKIFRMVKGGAVNQGIFVGETINTPSMLVIEDAKDALKWVDSIGGLKAAIKRTQDNLKVIEEWVQDNSWVSFLVKEPSIRSRTSVCLSISDPWFTSKDEAGQMAIIKNICALLEKEDAAYDIKSYKAAPPGFRIWAGATIDAEDIANMLPWLSWAYHLEKENAA